MKFLKSKVFIVCAIVTVLIVALMIVSSAWNGGANPISSALRTVITPVENAAMSVGGGISDIFSAGEYRAQCESAKQRVAELESGMAETDALKQENERLRALLDLKSRDTEKKYVAAEISAKNPNNWYEDYIINKGTNDGISQNNVVVTNDGLVGYVSETGPNWSRVITVLDPDASVGCIVQRSGDTAIADGDEELGQKGYCTMNYIEKDASVVVGDSVYTLGMGSMYPEGILIGKISEITPDLQGLYNKATVKTAVDFRKVKAVLVITG